MHMGTQGPNGIELNSMSLETYEQSHVQYIEKLVKAFGEDRKEKIEDVYNGIKEEHEGVAEIGDFIPQIVLREAKEEIKKHFGL